MGFMEYGVPHQNTTRRISDKVELVGALRLITCKSDLGIQITQIGVGDTLTEPWEPLGTGIP